MSIIMGISMILEIFSAKHTHTHTHTHTHHTHTHNTHTNLQFEKGVVANLFNNAVARRMGRTATCGICSCIDNLLITKVKTAIGLDRCRLLISGECVRLRLRVCVWVRACVRACVRAWMHLPHRAGEAVQNVRKRATGE